MNNKLRLLCTLMGVLMALTVAVGTPRAARAAFAATPCTGGCPYTLGPGGALYSINGDYVYNGPLKLAMQGDGNLVLYYNSTPIWATGTNNYVQGATYKAILQTDGNFVLYCYNGIYNRCGNSGEAIWASGTNGKSIDHLFVALDSNSAVWDDFLLIDQYNNDVKQSANTTCSSHARSNGPMAGPGSSCYPPNFTYPPEGPISVPEPDE